MLKNNSNVRRMNSRFALRQTEMSRSTTFVNFALIVDKR
ncbi:MAG: hypothetical protein QOH41_4465 [Blastocatellia bacterium]|jgi:hypothetical protein|nr:hypothetical protein [Blastocatellia bacterium]